MASKYPPDPPETCRYCRGGVEMVDDSYVYGESYGSKLYVCLQCQARVGTHDHNLKPYGILADNELRRWRGVAHAAFDPLHERGSMGRQEAYNTVFGAVGFPQHKRHVAMLDLEEVKKVIAHLMLRGPEL